MQLKIEVIESIIRCVQENESLHEKLLLLSMSDSWFNLFRYKKLCCALLCDYLFDLYNRERKRERDNSVQQFASGILFDAKMTAGQLTENILF